MEFLHTARFESPIGALFAATSERGLAYLELSHASGRGFAGWRRTAAPDARVADGFAPNRAAIAQVLEYLAGKRRAFELPLDLRGTPFQLSVWEALLAVPYGETRTYAEVARRIGHPAAVRAVGAANGANPVPLVVPCHRVVASGGGLGGYGGGLPLKRRLLALERAAPAPDRLL
ncbi:MAG TPA: methylated-DNA--[protein]-cysteine S-methyltransferase [Myxococcota bacterium]|nr:methylated-DNA--[protein]-cysteine S-methyltransferase [Myxococcota bacterium]